MTRPEHYLEVFNATPRVVGETERAYCRRLSGLSESLGISSSPNRVRNMYRQVKTKDVREYVSTANDHVPLEGKRSFRSNEDANTADLEYVIPVKGDGYRIDTLEKAVKHGNVDLDIWEVARWEWNSWMVTMKGEKGSPDKQYTNFQVKMHLRKKVSVEIPVLAPIILIPRKPVSDEIWPVIGCVHRPFHVEQLWESLLNLLHHNKSRIGGFIIAGDYLDLASLNEHNKYPTFSIDLGSEYSNGRKGIEEIDSLLPKSAQKYFMYGNHEDRALRNTSVLKQYGSAMKTLDEALGLTAGGWSVLGANIPNEWKETLVMVGDTGVFHGDRLSKSACLDTVKESPTKNHVFFHTHRMANANFAGKIALNAGGMFDRTSPAFGYVGRSTKDAWENGMANIYNHTDGTSSPVGIHVKDGKFIFEGRAY